MPIKAACPHCDRMHTLADDLQGRKVRCKGCDTPFTVEGIDDVEALPQAEIATAKPVPVASRRRARADEDDDDRPSRRTRDRDEDDYDRPARPRPKQKSGSSLALIIGLIVGGILLAVVVVGVLIGIWVRNTVDNVVHNAVDEANFPGMPPANADWNQLQRGMTPEQVIALFGDPAQDNTYDGPHVIHANVTQQEVTGPDGKQKPVRHMLYFKGFGKLGFVEITFVDGKVYKFKK
jgi:hypothetical protein